MTQDALTGAITARPVAERGSNRSLRRTGRKPAHWRQEASRWLVPLGLLAVWQVASQVGWINPRVLPAPTAVVGAFSDLTRSGELWHHFLVSLGRAGSGVLIGGGLGLLFGILTGTFRVAHLLLDSTFQMLRTIPNLALIPLVILWFGIGEQAKVFLIALATFFPVYGLSPAETFRRVTLPGALPGVLVGLRYALGISWLALVVSESFGASSGIGFLAMDAREFFRTDVIVLAIVIYALIGKVADALVRGLERLLLPWRVEA